MAIHRVSEPNSVNIGGLSGKYTLYFTGCQATAVLTQYDDTNLALSVFGQYIPNGGYIQYGTCVKWTESAGPGPSLRFDVMCSLIIIKVFPGLAMPRAGLKSSLATRL